MVIGKQGQQPIPCGSELSSATSVGASCSLSEDASSGGEEGGTVTPPETPTASLRAFLLPAATAAVTALCLGYDAGVMSGAIGPIRHDLPITDLEEGILMGCINLVAAPGAIVGGKVADRLGRVRGVAVTAFLLALGPLLVAVSTDFALLMIGRVITGLGVGLAFVIAPLYTAELAPPRIRAGVVTVTEILINLGVLLGYASALLLDLKSISPSVAWHLVTGLAGVPAAVTLLASVWLPESPRWLLQQHRRDEAKEMLARLSGGGGEEAVEKALAELEDAMDQEEPEAGWGELLCPSRVTCRMLLAGLGTAFFQQACGSEAIVYYTPTILTGFGIESSQEQNVGAVLMGTAKLAGACVGAFFLDLVGRRGGMLASCIGVAVCLLSLSLLQNSGIAALGLLLMCLFMAFFEVGLAPGAFVLGTECYPLSLRAKALSLGMFITRSLSGLVTLVFPTIVHSVSLTACFWFFTCAACSGVLWAFLCVPETKGLSLEEVARLFEGGTRRKK